MHGNNSTDTRPIRIAAVSLLRHFQCLLPGMQGLAVVLFPVLLMLFALAMERVEFRLRRLTVRQQEVEEFLDQASHDEVVTLAHEGFPPRIGTLPSTSQGSVGLRIRRRRRHRSGLAARQLSAGQPPNQHTEGRIPRLTFATSVVSVTQTEPSQRRLQSRTCCTATRRGSPGHRRHAANRAQYAYRRTIFQGAHVDDVLARAGIFQGVEPSAVAALTKQLQPVDFPRGHVIFNEGEPGDRLYIIVSGKVKIGRRSPDGRENLLTIMGPSDMFGELSIFDPGPRTSTATTVTEVRAVSMDREALKAWIDHRPRDRRTAPAGARAPSASHQQQPGRPHLHGRPPVVSPRRCCSSRSVSAPRRRAAARHPRPHAGRDRPARRRFP